VVVSFKLKQNVKIFSPEDFTEEQLMMRDSVKEFVDKELWAHKIVLKKDYAYTEESMRAGSLDRSCSSRSLWRIRNGFNRQC
jgi:hypothetical protein